MVPHFSILCVMTLGTLHVVSSLELQPGMPNVCADQEISMVGTQQPCVQAYTRLVKVWKQGCAGHQWCVGYERRTTYYTGYRQVYNMNAHTVYKCCPGWNRKGDEMGCLHRECDSHTCFNGGRCTDSGDQICQCPEGFKGAQCQYDQQMAPPGQGTGLTCEEAISLTGSLMVTTLQTNFCHDIFGEIGNEAVWELSLLSRKSRWIIVS